MKYKVEPSLEGHFKPKNSLVEIGECNINKKKTEVLLSTSKLMSKLNVSGIIYKSLDNIKKYVKDNKSKIKEDADDILKDLDDIYVELDDIKDGVYYINLNKGAVHIALTVKCETGEVTKINHW